MATSLTYKPCAARVSGYVTKGFLPATAVQIPRIVTVICSQRGQQRPAPMSWTRPPGTVVMGSPPPLVTLSSIELDEDHGIQPASLSATQITAQRKNRLRDFQRLAIAVWKTLFLQRGAVNLSLVGVRLAGQIVHLAASIAFVVLYVWSTYQSPLQGSWRCNLDLALSAFFAASYASRILMADSKRRALLDPMNVVDLLSFAPSLLEASFLGNVLQTLRNCGVDTRWFRIFRAVRVLRLLLLTGNLPLMKMSRNALLSGVVNVRLMQLLASVLALLFTSASLVQLAERMPWHDALYFVTTTITTVGFGDVVCHTMLGRVVVIATMVVGVVMIPARASQLYTQLQARREMAGVLPRRNRPFVLVSTRMSEVRAFSDLFTEFFNQLGASRTLPPDTQMVTLSNKPSYDFTAFQELNESRLTLLEGSVLSETDLVKCQAQNAQALLVLGDRFTNDADQEDLDVLFRVWAIKGYTKCVPLHVQCLRAATIPKILPFLDPLNDSVSSIEQTRHQLLALSCLCPGASTLVCNILHTAALEPELRDDRAGGQDANGQEARLAGQVWLAEYARGCGHELYVTAAGAALEGLSFSAATEAAFRLLHVVLIGSLGSPSGVCQLVLNPADSCILCNDRLVVLATSQKHADEVGMLTAATVPPVPPEPGVPRDVAAAAAEAAAAKMVATGSLGTSNGSKPPAEGSAAGQDSARVWRSVSLDEGNAVADISTTTITVQPSLGSSGPTSAADLTGVTPLAAAAAAAAMASTQAAAAAEVASDRPGTGYPTATAAGGSHGCRGRQGSRGSKEDALSSAELAMREALQATWPMPRTKGMPYRDEASQLQGHVILSGLNENFVAFAQALQRSAGLANPLPLVVLQPDPLPEGMLLALAQVGPVFVVKGSPADAGALLRANARNARCLVYMGDTDRPSHHAGGTDDMDYGNTSRAGVLTDAEALLTCYGVGESQGHTPAFEAPPGAIGSGTGGGTGSGAGLTGSAEGSLLGNAERLLDSGLQHAVVELSFTSSVRFLQPGLLLQGSSPWDSTICSVQQPRKSWKRRRRQEDAALRQGLIEWQVNSYFCAGRVTVPAVMDTFTCQAFFKRGLLSDLMTELCGSDGRPGGAMLRQIPVLPSFIGRTYGELFSQLVLLERVVPLGLYRCQRDAINCRLPYVFLNPGWKDTLHAKDRVFVLRRPWRDDHEV